MVCSLNEQYSEICGRTSYGQTYNPSLARDVFKINDDDDDDRLKVDPTFVTFQASAYLDSRAEKFRTVSNSTQKRTNRISLSLELQIKKSFV